MIGNVKALWVLAPLLLLSAGPTLGQSNQVPEIEREIRALNAREVDALLRNDVATLNGLWSNDFVVTNPFNKFIDKKQVVG